MGLFHLPILNSLGNNGQAVHECPYLILEKHPCCHSRHYKCEKWQELESGRQNTSSFRVTNVFSCECTLDNDLKRNGELNILAHAMWFLIQAKICIVLNFLRYTNLVSTPIPNGSYDYTSKVPGPWHDRISYRSYQMQEIIFYRTLHINSNKIYHLWLYIIIVYIVA